MTLPTTTRGSTVNVLSPDNEAAAKIIQLARTPTIAEYALAKFIEKMQSFGKAMVEGSQSMRKIFEKNVENAHMLEAKNENYWAGVEPKSDYMNYQSKNADLASQNLKENNLGSVKVDYTVSNASKFQRVYSENSTPLNEDSVKAFDKLLNSYLVENKLFIKKTEKGSFIYENDGTGHVRLDAKNNEIKADPDTVRELLSDNKKGFQQYLQQQGINSTVEGFSYPGEAPAAAKPEKEAAKAATKSPEAETPSAEEGQVPKI
ncbi:MAG: hypothetical protein H0U73_10575 [Tatlockia sp.]|nr:hypothetical protein [Tatlockia sp.]